MGDRRIVQDPAILVGKPVIRGTRISVEFVLERLSFGATIDELLEAYPRLQRDDILACLDYARAVIAQEVVPEPWKPYPLPL